MHKKIYYTKKKKIKKWIISIIKKNIEITICIVSIQEIQRLNFIYRNKNKPTNILSFPFKKIKNIKSKFIGDLIICSQIITKESIVQKKKLEMHWAHIIIHGTLHLLGYNHSNPEKANIMESIEIKKMIHLGYKNPYII